MEPAKTHANDDAHNSSPHNNSEAAQSYKENTLMVPDIQPVDNAISTDSRESGSDSTATTREGKRCPEKMINYSIKQNYLVQIQSSLDQERKHYANALKRSMQMT
ncbi:hypothetical protein BX616_004897 [Lobosporangium transversale]|nr:hypothetical protein BX616_004897 [Lobosporangium transversale]